MQLWNDQQSRFAAVSFTNKIQGVTDIDADLSDHAV
jgi:hypothetical protein